MVTNAVEEVKQRKRKEKAPNTVEEAQTMVSNAVEELKQIKKKAMVSNTVEKPKQRKYKKNAF